MIRGAAMRLMLLFIVILIAIPGASQGIYRKEDKEVPSISNIEELIKLLYKEQTMAWVVINEDDKSESVFNHTLSNKELAEIALPVLGVSYGSNLAKEITRERPGHKWILVNRKGEIVGSGIDLRDRKTIKQAFESTGEKTRIDNIRKFIKDNPNDVEAKLLLARELSNIGTRRILHEYGKELPQRVRNGSTIGTQDGMVFKNHSDIDIIIDVLVGKNIPNEMDNDVWDEYSKIIIEIFDDTAWATAINPLSYNFTYGIQKPLDTPVAKYSKICKDTYTRIIPNIEKVLRKFPSCGYAWLLIEGFSQYIDIDIDAMLEKITPSPKNSINWPPPSIIKLVISSYIKSEKWQSIEKFSARLWKELVELNQIKVQRTGAIQAKEYMNKQQWDVFVEKYIESLVVLDKKSEADEVLDTWRANNGWIGAYVMAVQLAEKRNQKSWAAEWRDRFIAHH